MRVYTYGNSSFPEEIHDSIKEMTLEEAIEAYPAFPVSVLKLIAKGKAKKKDSKN